MAGIKVALKTIVVSHHSLSLISHDLARQWHGDQIVDNAIRLLWSKLGIEIEKLRILSSPLRILRVSTWVCSLAPLRSATQWNHHHPPAIKEECMLGSLVEVSSDKLGTIWLLRPKGWKLPVYFCMTTPASWRQKAKHGIQSYNISYCSFPDIFERDRVFDEQSKVRGNVSSTFICANWPRATTACKLKTGQGRELHSVASPGRWCCV